MYKVIYEQGFDKNYIQYIISLLPEEIQNKIEYIREANSNDVLYEYSDPNWKSMKFPERDFIYIQSVSLFQRYVGGCDEEGGISIGIRKQDNTDTIALRIWHEILHSLSLDADGFYDHLEDMVTSGCLSWAEYGLLNSLWNNVYYYFNKNHLDGIYYTYLMGKL